MTDNTNSQRRDPRGGIMLFEVSAAISITAVLLYSVALLLASFRRIDGGARDRIEENRELWRLVEQFRDDVYAARDVERPNDKNGETGAPLLRLIGAANDRIEYRLNEDRWLTRIRSTAEKAIEQDAYGFGAHAKFSIEVAEGKSQLVTLVLTTTISTEDETDVAKRERRITARLARDHRYRAKHAQEDGK
jgi:type II secretory pathway component PulJ